MTYGRPSEEQFATVENASVQHRGRPGASDRMRFCTGGSFYLWFVNPALLCFLLPIIVVIEFAFRLPGIVPSIGLLFCGSRQEKPRFFSTVPILVLIFNLYLCHLLPCDSWRRQSKYTQSCLCHPSSDWWRVCS
jgi:hypothetical protein